MCRSCYDHARGKALRADPLHLVVHAEQLSPDARALLVCAIEHRNRTGKPGGLDDLRSGLAGWTQGRAWAALRECTEKGSGAYGFAPICRIRAKKPATSCSDEG